MGYDITGAVTITITKTTDAHILRQTTDRIFSGRQRQHPIMHLWVLAGALKRNGIEPYEPVTIYQKANILTIKADRRRLADITDDLPHQCYWWVARDQAPKPSAYLQGEDAGGRRWAWTAWAGAYTLTRGRVCSFSTKRLAAGTWKNFSRTSRRNVGPDSCQCCGTAACRTVDEIETGYILTVSVTLNCQRINRRVHMFTGWSLSQMLGWMNSVPVPARCLSSATHAATNLNRHRSTKGRSVRRGIVTPEYHL